MSCTAENMIADLAERGDFVVFAGAGPSEPTGIPTWKLALIKLNEQSPVKGLNIEKIDAVQYPNVAEMIYTQLQDKGREEEYHQAIEKTLAPSKFSCHMGHLKIVRACPSIVTTNLDMAFEEALNDEIKNIERYTSERRKLGIQTIPKLDMKKLGEKYHITYLHGRHNQREKVFKTSDYTKYYSALEGREESVIEEALRAIYISPTALVFVGFSFDDRYILRTFERLFAEISTSKDSQSKIGQIKHYAIINYAVTGDDVRRQQLLEREHRTEDVDYEDAEKLKKSVETEERLSKVNIEVVRIQYKKYTKLEMIFDNIVKQRAEITPTVSEIGEDYERIL